MHHVVSAAHSNLSTERIKIILNNILLMMASCASCATLSCNFAVGSSSRTPPPHTHLLTSPLLAPKQIKASLGELNKAINHALSLRGCASHDAGAEEPLESARKKSVVPATANLLFKFGN